MIKKYLMNEINYIKNNYLYILLIFIFLSLLVFAGYRNGLKDGEYRLCDKLGMVYLQNRECITKLEYNYRISIDEFNNQYDIFNKFKNISIVKGD